MKILCSLFLRTLIIFAIPVVATAQLKQVWVVSDGEKVFRDDLNHPAKNGNLIWDGKTIRLMGLHNETLAFQVIVETGEDSLKDIEVSVTNPVNKTSAGVIGGTTQKHSAEGGIEIFTEHYLHDKDSTRPNWFYGSPASAPKKMTGWIPDALIPTDAMQGRGGFPVDIGPKRNQGFWIDVELPRDIKTFAAGVYAGKVKIAQAGRLISEIPLEITLSPQYLPDENKNIIWMHCGDVESYFPELSRKQAEDMLKFEAHRHRITLTGGFLPNQAPFSDTMMRGYKKYFDGSAFTPEYGYHGTGEGVGEKLFPIGMYGARVMGDTKETVQEQANLWVNWFKANAPDVTYFWYITDEPDSARLAWVKARADWVHNNPGSGKALPVFTTTSYKKYLADDIDIWAGYNGVPLDELPGIRKRGGDHWFYNGNRPRYGSLILEGSAVDLRVNSWILYKYDIKAHFIWHSTTWDHNGQGPKKHLHQNMFVNPLTFINDDMEFGNGDGILFYPGRMPFYPGEDRGLNRVFPSIRLNNIRRGQQDAALMQLAEQKIGREKVIAMISKAVPKALSEVSMKDPVAWSEHGDDYDKIRYELIKLLK